ncbi:hypothetical protein Tco_1075507 [Tanacetum coccineum]
MLVWCEMLDRRTLGFDSKYNIGDFKVPMMTHFEFIPELCPPMFSALYCEKQQKDRLKQAQDEERDKRAVVAERRIIAVKCSKSSNINLEESNESFSKAGFWVH